MNYKGLAERLRQAESDRVQISRLTDEFPEMTVADAYQIQLENVAYKQAQGQKLIGMKIGLTSDAEDATSRCAGLWAFI